MDGMQVRSRVFQVAIENVVPIWPQVEPLLARAMRGCETHNALDVRRMVLGEQAHLWVQWNGSLQAFAITEFVVYPRGRWLRLWLAAAAEGVTLDQDAFEDVLATWKDANDCRGYEVIGRMGWLRRFPEARFCGAVLRTTT